MSVMKVGVGNNTNSMPSQDSLVHNGHTNLSYGTKPETTHVWVPADGSTGIGAPRTDGQNKGALFQSEGSTLTIHDIHYTVKVKEKACGCASKDKEILKGVK